MLPYELKVDRTKTMLFLYPGDYLHPQKIDENYLKEAIALQNSGFTTALISLEYCKIQSPIPLNSIVIYRGWMLSPDEYELLIRAIENTGSCAFTSKIEYLATHYLPNWYSLISDLTPETKFYSVDDDLETQLTSLGWKRFFIKDYVKSLKTSIGSVINKPSEIKLLIAEMKKFRGAIEGGICVRKVEEFIDNSEKRYFVLNGKIFCATSNEVISDIVKECADRIPSKFFSIDVAKRKDGSDRIVEIGDGQVSDLVGWTCEGFVEMWLK
jgi:hypothetical protein